MNDFYEVKTRYCPQCKQNYEYLSGWVEYKYNGIVFCSWNCKCKYKREYEKLGEKHYPTRKKYYLSIEEAIVIKNLIKDKYKNITNFSRAVGVSTYTINKLLSCQTTLSGKMYDILKDNLGYINYDYEH